MPTAGILLGVDIQGLDAMKNRLVGLRDAPERVARQAQGDLAEQIWEALVTLTPKWSGRARASWMLLVGRTATVSDTPPATNLPDTISVSRERQHRLGNYREARNLAIEILWVSSFLPYMRKLNEGWSPQASAHFVERAVNRVVLGSGLVVKMRGFEGIL